MSLRPKLKTLSIAFACAASLAGCAAFDVKTEVVEKTAQVKKGPHTPPDKTITGFSAGLRCMDDLMIFYGVRDVSSLVEDLVDTTKKVNAGTKDMLISAVSDMTKRSRSVRLIAFGADSGNLANFIGLKESRSPYEVLPQYDIRGSISQLDETLAQKTAEGAVNIGFGSFGASAGIAKTATTSMLGLDLTVISTADFSVVPGVTARNSVIIFKEGRGIDGEAEYKKFGISYGQTLTKSEGNAQALRTLVELAVIELFGKLTKTPYWKCLGADATHESVRTEIADWFYAMSADGELIAYMQKQLRLRSYYAGPIDGAESPAFADAVARSRADLGLSAEYKLDVEYFGAFLTSYGRAEIPAVAAQPAAGEAFVLTVGTANGTTKFKRGETINLLIQPSRNAYVACYLKDENDKIQRFYPNRFSTDPLVRADAPLQVPGNMRFQLVANDKGVRETVACFATERNVLAQLPGGVIGTDFETLPVASLDQIRASFVRVAGEKLAQGIFHVDFK